jgi:CHAT domain-containing protein
VGNATSGDGVYGLRRAFVIAGAESQVMTLWRVDDEQSKNLMVEYYDRILTQGANRSTALTQIQRDMLKNAEASYRHPYYWAGFIFSGDGRPLPDR